MSQPDIGARDDIERLLFAFYERAMTDDLLEPVFAASQMDLVTHLPRIASFWEVTLLHTGDYFGRPMQIHRDLVDTAGLRTVHFGRWLTIWEETVSDMFSGPIADKAILASERMGAAMARATGADGGYGNLALAHRVTALAEGRGQC
jgi:hemoglobin